MDLFVQIQLEVHNVSRAYMIPQRHDFQKSQREGVSLINATSSAHCKMVRPLVCRYNDLLKCPDTYCGSRKSVVGKHSLIHKHRKLAQFQCDQINTVSFLTNITHLGLRLWLIISLLWLFFLTFWKRWVIDAPTRCDSRCPLTTVIITIAPLHCNNISSQQTKWRCCE